MKTLLNSKFIVGMIESTSWLHRKFNAFAINRTVNDSRARPHPWSTIHDYTSWDALTQKTWSARHLPASKPRKHKSTPDQLSEFFRLEGEQTLSEKSTCLFPAFAQHLSDGFIRTRMPKSNEDQNIRLQNTSNHDIDLSPLYGRTIKQTRALRSLDDTKGQRGRLKSRKTGDEEYSPFLYGENGKFTDPAFVELDAPLGIDNVKQDPEKLLKIFAAGGDRVNAAPQIAMINTLFLREHNRLASIFEKENPAWDDERVFQTVRNTLIVLYIKIVVEEYINHISPIRIRFLADPEVSWTADWNRPNWITTEFSLLYRWHSMVPKSIKWGQIDYLTSNSILNNNPLLSVGLLEGFIDISNQRAGELGAFNTDPSLLSIEESAIKQDRLVRLQPFNNYRPYTKLPKLKSFGEISSNPKVVDFLKRHYESVDDVEYYIGLFAEDLRTNSPLPELLARMVAIDAFSQALTNPLMSRPVFSQKEKVFSAEGWNAITSTNCLKDVLERNVGQRASEFVGMTNQEWRYK